MKIKFQTLAKIECEECGINADLLRTRLVYPDGEEAFIIICNDCLDKQHTKRNGWTAIYDHDH